MSYLNRCGDCEYFEKPINKYNKGYCEYYKSYYYPEDSCEHYRSMTNVSTCYITTIVCNVLGLSDDCEVLSNLRAFRHNILQQNINYLPILMEYDTTGPLIAAAIQKEYNQSNNKTVCQKMYDKFLVPTSTMIINKNYRKAIQNYMNMVLILKEYYCIESPNLIVSNYDNSNGGHGILYTKTLNR